MTQLSLRQSAAISELASELYDYLPGSGAIITFATVAAKNAVANYWFAGRKLPALQQLLENTLRFQPTRFCDLILDIVREGTKYCQKKGRPLTREHVVRLNSVIAKLDFKIPELHDEKFLDILPHSENRQRADVTAQSNIVAVNSQMEDLRRRFSELLVSQYPQKRGYAFQDLLKDLFDSYHLAARGPFRLVGEEIDGSFEFEGDVYLLSARWRKEQEGVESLNAFEGKVRGKSSWTRGLFWSINGFSIQGLEAFGKGRVANMICMTGDDLYLILEGRCSLQNALRLKVRHAAETGEVFAALRDLI